VFNDVNIPDVEQELRIKERGRRMDNNKRLFFNLNLHKYFC
jgi:hypothetical protein